MFNLQQLINNLTLEPINALSFSGQSLPMPLSHVFGGQVLGQSLMAASHTVGDKSRQVHSLHAYFLRAGRSDIDIIYEVDPIRDGGSFTTRRVVAKQLGEAIFSTMVSFQRYEEGLEHQNEMPVNIPPPLSLKNDHQYHSENLSHVVKRPLASMISPTTVDIRSCSPRDPNDFSAKQPKQGFWFKFNGAIGDDPAIHQALLAYISDIGLLGTGVRPHYPALYQHTIQAASLDHALWIHCPLSVDQWIYYDMDSPRAGHGRNFNRGSFYNQQGILVASSAQEGLVRIKK